MAKSPIAAAGRSVLPFIFQTISLASRKAVAISPAGSSASDVNRTGRRRLTIVAYTHGPVAHGGPVRPFEIGLVLPMGEVFGGGSMSRWANIRDLALRAEEIGFDIVWTCDELL